MTNWHFATKLLELIKKFKEQFEKKKKIQKNNKIHKENKNKTNKFKI